MVFSPWGPFRLLEISAWADSGSDFPGADQRNGGPLDIFGSFCSKSPEFFFLERTARDKRTKRNSHFQVVQSWVVRQGIKPCCSDSCGQWTQQSSRYPLNFLRKGWSRGSLKIGGKRMELVAMWHFFFHTRCWTIHTNFQFGLVWLFI